jgi:hypothetical protein
MSVKRKKRNETDYLEENFWSSAKENNVWGWNGGSRRVHCTQGHFLSITCLTCI